MSEKRMLVFVFFFNQLGLVSQQIARISQKMTAYTDHKDYVCTFLLWHCLRTGSERMGLFSKGFHTRLPQS